jgi:hypothetical protein
VSGYWLDTDVYLRAFREFYAPDIAPGFWRFLHEQAEADHVSSPKFVYDELLKGAKGEFLKWLTAQKNTKMFSKSDRWVQQAQTRIADYVVNNYEEVNARIFLRGADSWVIAHAIQWQGKVVTFETPESASKRVRRVKIPDVCAHFDQQCTSLWGMMRDLGCSLR